MFLCRGVDRTGPFQCLKINKRVFVAQVPFDPVELEMNEKTQGLVSPEPFLLPIVSPLWTPVAYAAFDESNAAGKVRKGGGGGGRRGAPPVYFEWSRKNTEKRRLSTSYNCLLEFLDQPNITSFG